MTPDAGGYKVAHIYRDGPADKEWVNLKAGDYVTAIDGTPIKAGDNYWKMLNSPLNEYVTGDGRAAAPAGADARDVRHALGRLARPTSSTRSGSRRTARSSTRRRTARSPTSTSARWTSRRSCASRTRSTSSGTRKGIIVDIRYNGGGNIDQELIDILERRPYEYWNSRYGAPSWGRRPRQAIAGPKVMLINWRSASDSEVTPMAFKQLGLGRLVGNPTSAAVIATGCYALINGGAIRTPGSLVVTYDPERPNNYGINLENFGVAPDVWVENTPEDELAGRRPRAAGGDRRSDEDAQGRAVAVPREVTGGRLPRRRITALSRPGSRAARCGRDA